MMYDAGAKEVHMRISCPPIMYPDYYGIDTPDKDQLLASNMSLDEMTKYIGVKTLGFLSIEGIYKAMGYSKRNNLVPEFTDHYFTGEYPIVPLDQTNRDRKDNQLSLLSNIR
jgi:amidophosphoribosyltransferase